MAGERRQYTPEFKRGAIDMLNEGKSGHQVEQELGIGSGMVYQWRRELRGEPGGLRTFPGNGLARDEPAARLKQLEREIRELREDRDILAKAVAYFSKNPKRSSGS